MGTSWSARCAWSPPASPLSPRLHPTQLSAQATDSHSHSGHSPPSASSCLELPRSTGTFRLFWVPSQGPGNFQPLWEHVSTPVGISCGSVSSLVSHVHCVSGYQSGGIRVGLLLRPPCRSLNPNHLHLGGSFVSFWIRRQPFSF